MPSTGSLYPLLTGRDTEQAVGTLSGGERQAVAFDRAVYFGAIVLILDEPTSALGVQQSAEDLGLKENK
jgi:ABC-type sugar transport system ATPase subunit